MCLEIQRGVLEGLLVLPGGQHCRDLVSVAAVARLLELIPEVVAAGRTDSRASFVGDDRHIEALVLRRVAEDVHRRLLAGLHAVDLLQEHLAEQDKELLFHISE